MTQQTTGFRLHSFCLSSASWRVRLGLALKGITYETIAVHLGRHEQLTTTFAALNAMQQVPALVLPDGRILTQSVAILEFLEETFPSPPLLPTDPYLRARTRTLVEIVNSGIQPLQNTGTRQQLERLGADAQAFTQHFVAKGLSALEQAVHLTAGVYSVGDTVTLADVCLVPQLDKARLVGVDVALYPTLQRIEGALLALPAFRAARPEVQPDFEGTSH